MVPGDSVAAMLGDYAAPADVVRMRHDLKLDLPLWKQYKDFLVALAHGDLGQSISQHEPVARLIRERYPATLELAGAGLAVAMMIAFPLGIIAGADAGGRGDVATMSFAILGI